MRDLAAPLRRWDEAMSRMRQTGTFRACEADGGGEGVLAMNTLVTIRGGQFARIEMLDEGAAPD